MTTRRSLTLLVAMVFLAIAAFIAPGFSSATFTAKTSHALSSVSAALDWTPPNVTVVSPGSSVQGTVTVTAEASDPGSGVKDVVIEYSPVGSGEWTTLCTDTTAPYTCSWNTTALTDARFDLRATATDNSGYLTVSEPVRTAVANKLLVVMEDPGEDIRGTVTLRGSVFNLGAIGSHTVRLQYRAVGTSTFTNACSGLTSPYSCSWNTASVASGDYEFRAQLVSGTTSYSSEIVTDVVIDNSAPTVAMVDPGTPLAGTRTFAVTATDAHSGLAKVDVQYAATGTSSWTTLCTITGEPLSCRASTTGIANGSYSFRAVATDVAGNTATSAAIANRVVDNTISSVSLVDPGSLLQRTVTLEAMASSTAGVTSVRIQYAPTGTSTWTDICTDTASPYTCTWDTTRVVSAVYDLRAVLLDGSGRTTNSALDTVAVDNSPLGAADVQATNGTGSTVGTLGANDVLTLTYNAQINTASVLAGWNGAPVAMRVRLRDGSAAWRSSTTDYLEFQTATGGTGVNLGEVNLKGDYVKALTNVAFNATMSAATVQVNGLDRTVITIKLGTFASGRASNLKTVSTNKTMTWTPSNAVTDLFGNRSSTTTATESGTADRDF